MAPSSSVALDQWRGLALVLVLVSHGFYFTDRVHGTGRVGVNLFFFISGLLVHRSLTRRGGFVFLWRRLKRLYPALLAYVALMLPIGVLLDEGYVDSMPAALLYTMDYQAAEAPKSLGHLWSIACEMQFYALAPLIFLLGGRLQLALLAGLVAAGMLGPLLEDAAGSKYHFEIAVWPMMLGFCCERWKARLRKLPAVIVRGSLAVFAGGLCLMFFGVGAKTLVIATGAFAVLPCLFAYLSGDELPGVLGRLLAWLGQRTYSIYLWQQPLTICGYLPVALHPVGAVLSTFVGAFSFRWFERPFLSRGRKRDARVPALI
jgi:peptidoglycan/LPS O-acetylase OafA/YrhL